MARPEIATKTRQIDGLTPDTVRFEDWLEAGEPVIFKGLAAHWPLVEAGRQSAEAAMAYLEGFDGGRPVVVYTGAPEIGGRFFYNDDLTGLNFQAARLQLAEVLGRIRAMDGQADAPSIYIGSTDLDTYLPGMRAANDLTHAQPLFQSWPPIASIWMGNRTTAAAHWDMSNNIACCAVGRRRFTLFPPDQVHNLYPGPLEPTPGGQVVTMVDLRDPDFERFPRARKAFEAAQLAELEPGDVLFYPALWWHEVEALDPFNAMINYWWNAVPGFMDTPMSTLLHALLSLRDRPEAEKQAWRTMFDHYVFGPAERAGEHLPEHARGALGPMDDTKARRLRAQLLQRLNR
jgi:hypothetical protein